MRKGLINSPPRLQYKLCEGYVRIGKDRNENKGWQVVAIMPMGSIVRIRNLFHQVELAKNRGHAAVHLGVLIKMIDGHEGTSWMIRR